MNTKKETKQNWKLPKIVFKVFCLCIFLLYLQFAYLALSKTVYGKDLDQFALTRNTVKQNVSAVRGTIYDANQKILAVNVSSYTVIAYVNPIRSKGSSKPLHVEDVDKTAEALAPVLEMDVDYLKKLLSTPNVYQVELGPGGRGITELKKEEIENLNLPGIDFIEGTKRNYPNGDFASYVIGYAKENEVEKEVNGKTISTSEITGELGIEAKYNDLLKGVDGYLEYQQDKNGYKIPGTKEISIPAEDGANVYLTIDSGIQRFLEAAVKDSAAKYNPEWLMIHVMDAKTGDILGSASVPFFDPNIRNITNYESPLVTYTFEPGSTMKTYTYICAMEKGVYDGNHTYLSGSVSIGEDTIRDWNNVGFGTITLDKGYEYSSNVGAVEVVQTYLSKKELRDCLKKYGFGEKTGIELPREQAGSLNFTYPIEVATASFGQGITSTAIQQLQALTLLSNNGKMLTPHIVKRIEDPNTKKVLYERQIEESEQLIKNSTVEKMKQLMYNVIHGTDGGTTGRMYQVPGFDIIGKTGTSQIYDAQHGGYESNLYIYSFAGMYPKDDPQIIVYGAMKKPAWGTSAGLATPMKSIFESIAKYRNMFSEQNKENEIPDYVVPSYTSKKVEDITSSLKEQGIQVVTLGTGDKVVKQYPTVGTVLVPGDTVILKTNDQSYSLPSMIGWSRELAVATLNLLELPYTEEGFGFVVNQSLPKGTIVDGTPIVLTLEPKLKSNPSS